tara:strand:- start:5543 stop:6619 length:1077 start_codon:yes stop_codon:yes gene_type:complete
MALSAVGSQDYSGAVTSPSATTAGIAAASMNAIESSYVALFREGFEQAFQQTESKLQPFFEQETQNSEYQYFDRIGVAEDMQDDDTRLGDNPTSQIEHDRRRIGLKDYELGKYVDEKDLKRVLTDPMNAYTQAMLASGNRKIDDIIIDKYFGNAFVGKSGATTRTFVEGAGDEDRTNIVVGGKSVGDIDTAGDYVVAGGETEGFSIGANFGGSASGLTLAKLRAARRTMLRLHAIDQDEIVNCFVTAKQLDDLLGITEVVSSDFAVRKALAEGSVTTFLGFRFIHCERLPMSTGGGADERRIIVATPKALKMSLGTGLKGDMWRDPSKKNAPYLYYKLCADASRMWGEVAGEIRCNES